MINGAPTSIIRVMADDILPIRCVPFSYFSILFSIIPPLYMNTAAIMPASMLAAIEKLSSHTMCFFSDK